MPKPIKKRATTKTTPEADIKDAYENLKNYYGKHSKDVQTIGAVIIGVLLLAAALWGYVKYDNKKAVIATYKGLVTYTNMYGKGVLSDKERQEKALAEFKKSYEIKDDPITLYYIANVYYGLNDLNKAAETLNNLNATFTSSFEILPLSYYKLYNIYNELGQEEKALATIKNLYELNTPIYKDVALMEWGHFLKSKGKDMEAIAKYKEIIQKYPSSPFAKDAQLAMLPKDAPNKLLNTVSTSGASNVEAGAVNLLSGGASNSVESLDKELKTAID